MTSFTYAGSELELFAAVRNWKKYWSGQLRPFVGRDVLEVGAGIGANTPFLDAGGPRRWVCLEPDPELLLQLTRTLGAGQQPSYETICGTLESIDSGRQFDTIVYIDVLEHIEDDRAELKRASAHLKPNGHLIVLSPAHNWLFTPFDKAIGHFRRYNRSMLRAISPPDLRIERLRYLDFAGLALSAGNRLFLRQSMPTKTQLSFWDSVVVPVSRITDRLLFYSLGKSIIAVWRKL